MEYIFRKKETKAQASSKNNGISNISTTKITNRRSNSMKEFFFSLHRTCSTFIIRHQRMDSSQNISESEHYNSCGWICTNRINVCISWCKYFNEFHVSIRGVSAIGMFRWICELQSFQMQSVRSFRRCKIREYSDNFGRDTRIILILIITMVIRDRWNNDVKHRLCSSTCKCIKFWIYWSIWEKY